MNKFLHYMNKWYLLVIIGMVLIISFLSWFKTAEVVLQHFLDKDFIADEISDTIAGMREKDGDNIQGYEKKNNVFKKFINKFDWAIDKFDSIWSVYNNRSFSKIDTFLTYYITDEISSVQVLKGKNNWLFYKSKSDGDTIADFEGTNYYTQEELEDIAKVTLLTQHEIENRGIKFALLVAPNKENVYFENMPDNYRHSEFSRTDLLIQFLQKNRINVISPKSELLNNHLEYQLYYSYDTHWNQLGAYIGVRNILKTWEINIPQLSERNISLKTLNGSYHDLADMLGLKSVFCDDMEHTIDGTILIDYKSFEKEQNTNHLSHFHNTKARNTGIVLLVGDSFRTAMVPSLREEFSDVYVIHRSFYKAKILDDIKPDYLIIEYVERYSDDIVSIDEIIR